VTEKGGGCSSMIGGCGIAFELIPPKQPEDQWREQVLYRFQERADGARPTGGLLNVSGALCGTTATTIFSIVP